MHNFTKLYKTLFFLILKTLQRSQHFYKLYKTLDKSIYKTLQTCGKHNSLQKNTKLYKNSTQLHTTLQYFYKTFRTCQNLQNFYKTLQHFTKRYTITQNLHTTLHNFSQFHKSKQSKSHNSTQLHATLHNTSHFTRLFFNIHNCIQLMFEHKYKTTEEKPTQPYMAFAQLYKNTQLSNTLQKSTKLYKTLQNITKLYNILPTFTKLKKKLYMWLFHNKLDKNFTKL